MGGEYAVYLQERHSDHLLHEGEVICDMNEYAVSENEGGLSMPVEDVETVAWWLLIGANRHGTLCPHCRSIGKQAGVFPDDIPSEIRGFECPECMAPVDRVLQGPNGTLYAEHHNVQIRHSFCVKEYITRHENSQEVLARN